MYEDHHFSDVFYELHFQKYLYIRMVNIKYCGSKLRTYEMEDEENKE